MGCFGPFSVAGFMAGITSVACMTALESFFPMGNKMVCLYKSRVTCKSPSLEVCSGPGRVRSRVGLDFKCLFQLQWFCPTICFLPAWGSQGNLSKFLCFKVGVLPGSVQGAEAVSLCGPPSLSRYRKPYCSLQQLTLGFVAAWNTKCWITSLVLRWRNPSSPFQYLKASFIKKWLSIQSA